MGYFDSKERARRLENLQKETSHNCVGGAYYDERKGRIVRYYRGKRSKYLKQLSSKKCRHSDATLQNSQYKKVFDYWWELF